MDEIAIKVEGVSKTFRLPHEKRTSVKSLFVDMFRRRGYEKQKVLNNASFEIKKGEFFGIVGRNGSGKSTLLKLLAGIYVPDSGQVAINGSLTPFIELGVGFNPELTGRENVFLNGALLGFNRKQMEAMYDDIVDFAEIKRFMDQKLKNYSSGMQVRLAFSIAIRANTDILLIDEVLAVGDALFQQKCFNFFKEIKGKKTVVFISHDMRSVEKFCDRAMIINKGDIVDIGKPQDIVFEYGALLTESSYSVGAQTPGQMQGTHLGTGEIKINKVEVMNSKNKPASVLNIGEKFTFRTHYVGDTAIDSPVFLVTIFDSNGVKLFSSTTEASNYKIAKASKGRADLEILSNPLAPGKYKYNVGIFGPNMVVAHDHFRDAGSFTINGSNWGDYKIIMDSKWSVVNK